MPSNWKRLTLQQKQKICEASLNSGFDRKKVLEDYGISKQCIKKRFIEANKQAKITDFFLCKILEIYYPKKSIANLVYKLNLVDRLPVTKAVH